MIDQYKSAVEAYAQSELGPYCAAIETRFANRRAKPKDFNDPVWGTLELSAIEVLVLDSPLMQRLRSVRQLGVAHLVYPSAVHSRFEHSVGALHMVRRMLTAAADSGGPVPDDLAQLLRLAALCHDIGHCVLSHVAENALRYSDAVEDLRNEFTAKYNKEKSLGEINSYLLIGSPAFQHLLKTVADAAGVGFGRPNPHGIIQRFVLGEPVDLQWPTLHHLITGPFDADKLDYMTRDAFMSGVPLVTDVNRLVRKIRAVVSSTDSLPPFIQKLTERKVDSVTVLAIDRSGNRTLDELTLGRTLLFDKIYRHQKTRAAEALVAALLSPILENAEAAGCINDVLLRLLALTDDDLMRRSAAEIFPILELTDQQIALFNDLRERYRLRQLFVRAVEFSRKMTDDPYDQDADQARGLQELLQHVEEPVRRRELCGAISSEVADACAVLGRSPGEAGSLQAHIWLDAARSGDHLAPSSKALLVIQAGRIVSFEDEAPETTQWARAYHQTRESAYIFAPPELADVVALCAEKVVRQRFGVRLPALSLHGSRSSPSDLVEERRLLDDAGFYASSPLDLRPEPACLSRGDSPAKLAAVASRLHGYFPPFVEPTRAGRDQFDPRVVEDFVTQFATDTAIEAALEVLGGIELIRRQDIVSPIFRFLDERPEYGTGSLVVFGSGADSSSVTTYYARDIESRYPDVRVLDLSTALGRSEPILFVDDIIGSGRQAASIVKAWFGDTSLAEELGEQRQVLPVQMRELLQERTLGFCFAASASSGVEVLVAALDEVGISRHAVHIGRDQYSLPSIFTAGTLPSEQRAAFVERCRDIGAQLLADQDPEKREKRTLGYGNHGLLLAFPYNTPSHTLTCLWQGGVVDDRPWTPLIPRRRKR